MYNIALVFALATISVAPFTFISETERVRMRTEKFTGTAIKVHKLFTHTI